MLSWSRTLVVDFVWYCWGSRAGTCPSCGWEPPPPSAPGSGWWPWAAPSHYPTPSPQVPHLTQLFRIKMKWNKLFFKFNSEDVTRQNGRHTGYRYSKFIHVNICKVCAAMSRYWGGGGWIEVWVSFDPFWTRWMDCPGVIKAGGLWSNTVIAIQKLMLKSAVN